MSIRRNDESGEPVQVRRMGAIALLVINRPDANNAIDNSVRDGLLRGLDDAERDDEVRAILFAGSGNEVFSVGSDVTELASLTPIEAEALARKALHLHERIAACPKPTLAALKGPCSGAGLELAVHCDIRIARGDSRFGFPGINIGIIPGGGTVARLVRLVGSGAAQMLLLTGGLVTAERALMLGLVTNIVEPDKFRGAVFEIAGHITTLSPVALREIKAQLGRVFAGDVEGARAATPASYRRCFEEGDAMERLKALYGGPGPETSVH